MKTKFVVRFYFGEKDSITLPVKADHSEAIANRIVSAYKENKWLSFPAREGYRKLECTSINLEKVKYYHIEKSLRATNEKYSEEDFILM